MRIGYDRDRTAEYGRNFGVIILSAGFSSRMKAFKPLLPVDGRTAIEGLMETAGVAGAEDIIVVTGHNREEIAPLIAKHGAKEAFNESYADGMFSSIQKGLAFAEDSMAKASAETGEAAADRKGFLLMPVDSPLISVRVMRLMMAEASEHPDSFAVATYEGKKGHPLYIPAAYAKEICESDGEGGLAAITDRYSITRVETGEEGCVLDMDTPEAYADMKAFVSKGFAREKLEILTARKRIFLVRHGETRQHEDPMFIGQYDVPMNDEGCRQAREAGKQIAEAMREDVEAEALGMDRFGKEPMPAIERIYSSDLARAREAAEIIRDEINAILPEPVEIKFDQGLREINLGPWDGKPVREIRENHPEEYEKRGRDMMSFKVRGGENFYDMQYRALAALREILRNDDAKDIIIVTHSGIIRALENNISGGHVDDSWEPLDKGAFRMLEPFPVQPREKVHGDKPMNMNDMTMESVLEYYE